MATDGGGGLDLTLELPDGRTLGYLDIGDREGRPVISNHGGLSSRLDVLPAHEHALALGVRLVAPDRPGIGRSTAQADRSLHGWADDVAALADALGFERAAVLGWSFGGAFAQAVARFHPDRVTRLGLVASTIPSDWPGFTDEINRMDRRFLKLSERRAGRAELRSILHLVHVAAAHAPAAFAKRSGFPGDSPHDLADAVAAGLGDTHAVVDEYRLLGGLWGFDPAEIAVPTDVWQGDADDLVPPTWGERLAEAIPDAELHPVAGGTHYLWYDHWDEIFRALAPG